MGNSWTQIGEPVRCVHATLSIVRAHGHLRIEHGRHHFARLIARMLRLPRPSPAAETPLIVTARAGGEHWQRTFNGRCLETRQYESSESELAERFGVLEFRFRLDARDGSLLYVQREAAFLFGSIRLRLKLHAARDFFYAALFGTLPWLAWHGSWVLVLVGVLIAEIILTLTDFVVEIAVRKPLGDVYAGERVTHAVMGILYGAMIARLIPVLIAWWPLPNALVTASPDVQDVLRRGLVIMAVGVLVSGLRDLYAPYELPHGGWPWR